MNLAKKITIVALAGTAACMIACGDDSSVEVENQKSDDSMDILAHNEDLDKQDCDKSNAGEKLFVVDSNAAFVCNGKSWELYDAMEDISGKCTTKSVKNAKKTKSGVQITCDDVVVDTLWAGDKGKDEADENGCSFKSVKNKKKTKSGMEVLCGEVVVDTIWNDSDAKDNKDSKESADSKKDSDSKESADSKKDSDSKESADSKKDGDSKESADSKKDSDSKESADSRKDGDSKESADSKKDSDSKESADSKKDGDSKESADNKKDSDSKDGEDGEKGADGKNGADGRNGDDCVQTDIGHSVTIQCGDAEPSVIPKAMCITIPYDPAVSYCKDGYVLTKEGEFPTGTMVDERKFQEYKIVKIGNDIWMAENLNYVDEKKTEGSVCGGGSRDNPEGDCDTYGRLYNFEAVSQACPDGWKLPTYDDASDMLRFVENAGYSLTNDLRTTDLWEVHRNGVPGTDKVGFSAVPSGYYVGDGTYYGTETSSVIWTSEFLGATPYTLMIYNISQANVYNGVRSDGYYAVRCVKE